MAPTKEIIKGITLSNVHNLQREAIGSNGKVCEDIMLVS